MQFLGEPPFRVGDIIDVLGDGPRAATTRTNAQSLTRGEAGYIEAGREGLLHSLTVDTDDLAEEDYSDLQYAYSLLKDKRQLARSFYNLLEASARDKKCPTCLERSVAAMDHYLPKSVYARFAILPANLVPICTKCNGYKLAKEPDLQEERLLHPYFDDLSGFKWLGASVVHEPGAPVVYAVRSLPNWSTVLGARVSHQFEVLELSDLWASSMSTWLSANRRSLSNLLIGEGPAAVKDELLKNVASYEEGGVELWRPAAWRAWAASSWFCNGGW